MGLVTGSLGMGARYVPVDDEGREVIAMRVGVVDLRDQPRPARRAATPLGGLGLGVVA
jgi:hypothetical protein